jgi:hypothetical protein
VIQEKQGELPAELSKLRVQANDSKEGMREKIRERLVTDRFR